MFKTHTGLAGALGFALLIFAVQSSHAETNTIGQLICGAEQIAKFDGSDWACAEDETGNGGAPSFVLMDSDDDPVPKQVGEVISVDVLGNDIRTQRATVVLEFIDSTRTPALAAGRKGFDHFGAVSFDAVDCGGAAWQNELGDFTSFPEFLGYVTPGPTDPDVRRLYIRSSDDLEPIAITAKSSLFGGNSVFGPGTPPFCTNSERPIKAYPLELADPNLHATYPPPYTLVRQ